VPGPHGAARAGVPGPSRERIGMPRGSNPLAPGIRLEQGSGCGRFQGETCALFAAPQPATPAVVEAEEPVLVPMADVPAVSLPPRVSSRDSFSLPKQVNSAGAVFIRDTSSSPLTQGRNLVVVLVHDPDLHRFDTNSLSAWPGIARVVLAVKGAGAHILCGEYSGLLCGGWFRETLVQRICREKKRRRTDGIAAEKEPTHPMPW